MTLTQSRLKELLKYDPQTGEFTWNVSLVGRKFGKKAGCILKGKQSIQIMLDYNRYSAHRLAFLYQLGYLPSEVDHINNNPSDNRWCNLREVTHSQNLLNRRVMKHNRSGIKHVSYRPDRNAYYVTMMVDGKRKFIGYYKDITRATEAALDAAKKYHGTFALC